MYMALKFLKSSFCRILRRWENWFVVAGLVLHNFIFTILLFFYRSNSKIVLLSNNRCTVEEKMIFFVDYHVCSYHCVNCCSGHYLFNYIYRENWCSYAYIHYKIKKTIFQIEPHSLLFIAKKTVSDTISYRTCSAGISFVLLCYLLPVVQKIIYMFIRVDIGGDLVGVLIYLGADLVKPAH